METDRLKQDRLKRVASDGQGEREKDKVCVTCGLYYKHILMIVSDDRK